MYSTAPRKLEMKFLGWLFIILCAQALSSSAVEIFSTTGDTGFVPSKQYLMREQEANGVKGTTSLHGESDGKGYVLKEVEVSSKTGQKGKGSYGGANIVHRPNPSERSVAPASSLKGSPFFMLSTAILFTGFSFVCLSLLNSEG